MKVYVLERIYDETNYSEIESIYKTYEDAKEDIENWACVLIGEEFENYEHFDEDIGRGQILRIYYLDSPLSHNHKLILRVTEWEVE